MNMNEPGGYSLKILTTALALFGVFMRKEIMSILGKNYFLFHKSCLND